MEDMAFCAKVVPFYGIIRKSSSCLGKSIMADLQQPENSEGPQAQPNSVSTSSNLNVGGNIGGNAIFGNNNVINYHSAVTANVEKHEPDYWALKHPYPMPPNFTGRIAERALLTHWLKEDSENRLFILRALGGFGKSALKLATCDGPPYYYKMAYEEAERMLEKLKNEK